MKKYIFMLLATSAISACGDNPKDRALSGAGVGAGVGAVGSSLMGGNPVTGAVVGAGVGAVTGAATDKDDIDLGKPAWKR